MVKRETSNGDEFEYPEQQEKMPVPSNRDDLPEDPNRMSVSRMQLFEKCPYAYRLSYVEGLKCLDEDNERLSQGKQLHELFYLASLKPFPEAIREMYGYRKYQDDCERWIEFSRLKWRKTGTCIPLHAEYEIFDEEFNMLMYIDRIDSYEDGLEILDYKTGGYKDISCYRFQLAAYAYFVEKYLKLKVKRWGVFFSQKGMVKYEKADRHKIELVPVMIKLVRERVFDCRDSGVFKKRNTTLCRFCAFLQHGLCSVDLKEEKANGLFGILDVFKDYKEEKSDFVEAGKES
jgi:hypothetical protein